MKRRCTAVADDDVFVGRLRELFDAARMVHLRASKATKDMMMIIINDVLFELTIDTRQRCYFNQRHFYQQRANVVSSASKKRRKREGGLIFGWGTGHRHLHLESAACATCMHAA